MKLCEHEYNVRSLLIVCSALCLILYGSNNVMNIDCRRLLLKNHFSLLLAEPCG
jgi:hypothetical protein